MIVAGPLTASNQDVGLELRFSRFEEFSLPTSTCQARTGLSLVRVLVHTPGGLSAWGSGLEIVGRAL
jgi:hypothetical protein